MFPTTTPTHKKSASLQVVFSVLSCGPSNGSSSAGRILMMTPLANPPMTAPLRPPVALPKMAAVAPVKKCGTRFGMMIGRCSACRRNMHRTPATSDCLLYTSDAADDQLCVDLGGRRIIKKKINLANKLENQRTPHASIRAEQPKTIL